jgi:hypothetical protein
MFAATRPPKPYEQSHAPCARIPDVSFGDGDTISVRHYSVFFPISFSSIWTPKFQRIVVFLRSLEVKKGASN